MLGLGLYQSWIIYGPEWLWADFSTSETSEKCLIIQVIKVVMNNKSTKNTQENVVKHTFIEFSAFHAILQ